MCLVHCCVYTLYNSYQYISEYKSRLDITMILFWASRLNNRTWNISSDKCPPTSESTTQQKYLSFVLLHVNHQVSTWIIITGSAGGAALGEWRSSVEKLSFHAYLRKTDAGDSALGHYKCSGAAVWQPRGSSWLFLGPKPPGRCIEVEVRCVADVSVRKPRHCRIQRASLQSWLPFQTRGPLPVPWWSWRPKPKQRRSTSCNRRWRCFEPATRSWASLCGASITRWVAGS